MEKYIANYQVVIESDSSTGVPGYVATVPALGIADDGDSIEEALANIQATISFHIDSLMAENAPIPAQTQF